jgi:acetoin utilization protein AcuB
MTARDLINDSFPPLKPDDTGLKAIRWMEEFRLDHLPLVDQTNYIGLISEQDVLKLDSLERPLSHQQIPLIKPFAKANQPIFEVVKIMAQHHLTLIPVVDDDNHYLGLINTTDLLKYYKDSGIFDDATGVVVLEMDTRNYSLSEIAHLVELEDAKILSSFVTPHPENETFDITLKINQVDLSRILSSFSRHGYYVKEHYNQAQFVEDLRSRYDSLIKYLDI